MAQYVKALAAKPDDLFESQEHMVEGENRLLQVVL